MGIARLHYSARGGFDVGTGRDARDRAGTQIYHDDNDKRDEQDLTENGGGVGGGELVTGRLHVI